LMIPSTFPTIWFIRRLSGGWAHRNRCASGRSGTPQLLQRPAGGAEQAGRRPRPGGSEEFKRSTRFPCGEGAGEGAPGNDAQPEGTYHLPAQGDGD
jgi:hypothetical protein